MKKRNIFIKIILTVFLISSIYLYKYNHLGKINEDVFCSKYLANYKDKYDEIRKNYDLLDSKYNYIPAEVVSLSITKINNLFMINKGLDDGVKIDSFVVNNEGLVGIIKKVYKNKSLVKLISSNNTKISIETNECYGSLTVNKNKAVISDLVNCNGVEIGDYVYTSKYNNSDANILIGKIINVKNDRLYIDFFVNPYKVRYVGVISASI